MCDQQNPLFAYLHIVGFYLLINQLNRISDYVPFFSMHDGLYLWFWIFLQACADIKGSESSVESVECIAEWKEGSTYYFLGKKTIYNKTIKHFHT